MPRILFKCPLGEWTAEVSEGARILDAAEAVEAPVGHSCGGVCACSTCHVWVRKGLESLSEPSDQELDRLDQAFDVRPSSRLSCQSEVGTVDLSVEITEESLSAYMDEQPDLRRKLEAEGRWPLK